MPPLVKKIIIGFGIAMLVLLLSAVMIAAFFENSIGKKVIAEANKQLKTELTVRDFDLSLLRGFPNASAELLEVSLKDTRKGNLLKAKKVAFRIGIFSLFQTKMNIQKIVVEDGVLNLYIDRNGKGNFDILKESKDTAKTSSFSLDVEQAVLRNVLLSYKNDQSRQRASLTFEDAVFSGEFSEKQFEMESLAKLKTHFIDLEGVRFLTEKEVGYSAKLMVSLPKGFYDIQRLQVAVEKNVFEVDGFVDGEADGTDYDLKIQTTKDGNLESIIQLLPERYTKSLGDFRSEGNFSFQATVKGKKTGTMQPAILAKFRLAEGRISSPRLEDALTNVSFSGTFSNGRARTSKSTVLEIPDFKGYFNRELLTMQLRIENMEAPAIDFGFDGALPLASIHGLFNLPSITDGSGEIEVKNLRVEGKYKDMVSPDAIRRVNVSGSLELDDAAVVVNKEKMLFDRGAVVLADNKLTVNDLRISGAGSDLVLEGEFSNFLPVFFADSTNSENAELVFRASLQATEMDFDRLVALTEAPASKSAKITQQLRDSLQTAETQNRKQFTQFLKGTFQANIRQFNYDQIQGEKFKGDFTFENNRLLIAGEAFGMDGSFDLDGVLYFENEPYLTAKIETNEIDITEFLEQTQNFGQAVIRSEHLRGSLTSRLFIEAFWDEKGNFQDDKLHALAAVSIQNGELVGMEMLKSFSKYIHLQDLQHIKFVDMENWLEVKSRKVFLPVMFIRSNALNLTLNGEHGFDKSIDYNFKINMGQALLNFLKPHNPNLAPQKAERNGWFNVYYNLHGSVDNYKVTNKWGSVKRTFERSERHKKEIKTALVKEFGPFELIDEPEDWHDAGDPPPLKPTTGTKPEDDEFIEWEE